MNQSRVAVVFSGHGVLREPAADAEAIRSVIGEVNDVALKRLRVRLPETVTRAHLGDVIRRPELIQLMVFGLSVAAYRCRRFADTRPAVLLGHGLGELVALVCAGGFSVAEGAEIICHRAAALKEHCKRAGSMLWLGADGRVAESLVRLARPHAASVAAENSPTETMISGSYEAIDRIASVAFGVNIPTRPLRAPYPLHCGALMAAAVGDLRDRLRALPGRSLHAPVFSPILNRHYGEADHLGECVAGQLGMPIRFLAAVCRLRAMGIDEFVEAGVLNGGPIWHDGRDAERTDTALPLAG